MIARDVWDYMSANFVADDYIQHADSNVIIDLAINELVKVNGLDLDKIGIDLYTVVTVPLTLPRVHHQN